MPLLRRDLPRPWWHDVDCGFHGPGFGKASRAGRGQARICRAQARRRVVLGPPRLIGPAFWRGCRSLIWVISRLGWSELRRRPPPNFRLERLEMDLLGDEGWIESTKPSPREAFRWRRKRVAVGPAIAISSRAVRPARTNSSTALTNPPGSSWFPTSPYHAEQSSGKIMIRWGEGEERPAS
jgi:hypothetical protein